MPVSDQGVSHDRYMFIPRTLIFLTRGEYVLLLKGAPHKRLWAGKYNGVGGHIEAGEDVISAAERELAEETGLTARLQLCGFISVHTGQTPGIGIFVLKGECTQGEPTPSREGTLEWVLPSEALQLPLVEDLPQLLPRVLNHPNGAPPFVGQYSYDDEGHLRMQFRD